MLLARRQPGTVRGVHSLAILVLTIAGRTGRRRRRFMGKRNGSVPEQSREEITIARDQLGMEAAETDNKSRGRVRRRPRIGSPQVLSDRPGLPGLLALAGQRGGRAEELLRDCPRELRRWNGVTFFIDSVIRPCDPPPGSTSREVQSVAFPVRLQAHRHCPPSFDGTSIWGKAKKREREVSLSSAHLFPSTVVSSPEGNPPRQLLQRFPTVKVVGLPQSGS